MESTLEVPVLVVGGGVVGLFASLFLRRQGVEALLVEKHAGSHLLPRARGLNGRSMELARSLGLDAAIREAGSALAEAVGLHRGRTLREVLDATGDGGCFLRHAPGRAARGEAPASSPVAAARCTQDVLEPLLRRAASERGCPQRWETRFEELAVADDHVTGVLIGRDGDRRPVRARWLVAADGARSPIREALGIGRSGDPGLGHHLNVLFRADLGPRVAGREFSMALLGEPGALLASIDNASRWVIHLPSAADAPVPHAPAPAAAIRERLGCDVEVEILGVSRWQSAVRLADRYREGPVFLAGYAAHAMPPWGGFGANTGIADVHGLAWRLAWVLQGRAHPGLLDSYEAERRPVAARVSALAASFGDERGMIRVASGFGLVGTLWRMRAARPYLTVGYGYASDAVAVAVEPGPPPGPRSRDLRGRPGTRVPHAWLSRGGERVSSLDLVGPGLAAFTVDQAWAAVAREEAEAAGLPLAAHVLGVDVEDPSRRYPEALGVGRGISVVRPDGFVLWRARGAPDRAALAAALRLLTGGVAPSSRRASPRGWPARPDEMRS